ncbi:MAG: P-type conjugative transfer protein TrbG [Sphingomonas sp.]|nr:P-type conjugative transfer protein TrbG [Sphingomonas sp.]
MIRPGFLIIPSAISLSACASGAAAAPPNAAYLAATLVSDEVAAAAPVRTAAVVAPAAKSPLSSKGRKHPSAPPLARVKAANRAAVQEPNGESYVGAVQVYPWADGALYRLYTAPEQVSDIALQPGETLVSVAAGDTARWVIGDTSSGSGPKRRTHILVKPSAAGLRTNMVIATDRRVYHVEIESNAGTAMAGIAWSYPEDPLLALRGSAAADPAVAPGVAVEALNFNYRIDGDRPPWRPLRAFDDGQQVFIEFPPTLGQGEAPPLFVIGQGGRAELVNYRVRGHYYVVDRLFAAAELRLGEKRQQVVRIVRDDSRRGRGRSGS